MKNYDSEDGVVCSRIELHFHLHVWASRVLCTPSKASRLVVEVIISNDTKQLVAWSYKRARRSKWKKQDLLTTPLEIYIFNSLRTVVHMLLQLRGKRVYIHIIFYGNDGITQHIMST